MGQMKGCERCDLSGRLTRLRRAGGRAGCSDPGATRTRCSTEASACISSSSSRNIDWVLGEGEGGCARPAGARPTHTRRVRTSTARVCVCVLSAAANRARVHSAGGLNERREAGGDGRGGAALGRHHGPQRHQAGRRGVQGADVREQAPQEAGAGGDGARVRALRLVGRHHALHVLRVPVGPALHAQHRPQDPGPAHQVPHARRLQRRPATWRRRPLPPCRPTAAHGPLRKQLPGRRERTTGAATSPAPSAAQELHCRPDPRATAGDRRPRPPRQFDPPGRVAVTLGPT